MIGLDIQSPSLDRLRARWDEAPVIVREELAAGMRDATDAARDEIKARTPVRTGALRASIVSRFTQVGTAEFRGEVAVLNPGAAYVRFVEEDTRAHVIRPRFTQALRFSVAGRVVFAKSVQHPGTTGQHFFRDGAAAAAPRVRRIFSARLGNVTKRLGRREMGDRIGTNALLAAVAVTVRAVPGVSKVEIRRGGHAPWVQNRRVKQSFWEITRPRKSELGAGAGQYAEERPLIQCEGYMPFDYALNTEEFWNDVVDAVEDALRANPTLKVAGVPLIRDCGLPQLTVDNTGNFSDGEKVTHCHHSIIQVTGSNHFEYITI